MPRKSPVPLEDKNIRLVAGDWERLRALFPAIGPSIAIRTLVHQFVLRAVAAVEPLEELDLPSDINLEALSND
jgi:hypothetical protein